MENFNTNRVNEFDSAYAERQWQGVSAEQAYRAPGEHLVHHPHYLHHHHKPIHTHHLPELSLEHHRHQHHDWRTHHHGDIHRSFEPTGNEPRTFRSTGSHTPARYEARHTEIPDDEKVRMTQIVAQHAREIGLSKHATVAAVAAMLQESGGNPNAPGDFGKRDHQPHSFGLFQLNFNGGEGTANGLSIQQALDPHINTEVALKYFKMHDGQGYSAGQLAKMAQNPGDRNYIANVNNCVPEAERLLGHISA